MITSSFTALGGAQFMQLTTYRKNGQGVPTPVWFVDQGGVLFTKTAETTGKVKRIRNNPRVTVVPCTAFGKATGPAADGKAYIVTDPKQIAMAEAALAKKYGIMRPILYAIEGLNWRLRGRQNEKNVYLAVEPVS